MKKIFIILLSYSSAFAQSNFEGFKFGVKSESITGLTPRAEKWPIKSYIRKNDPLIKKYLFLSEVIYSFNENNLYMIILTSKTDRMIAVMKSKYGEPGITPDNKMYWEKDGIRINLEYQGGTYAMFVFDIESFKKVLIASGAVIK